MKKVNFNELIKLVSMGVLPLDPETTPHFYNLDECVKNKTKGLKTEKSCCGSPNERPTQDQLKDCWVHYESLRQTYQYDSRYYLPIQTALNSSFELLELGNVLSILNPRQLVHLIQEKHKITTFDAAHKDMLHKMNSKNAALENGPCCAVKANLQQLLIQEYRKFVDSVDSESSGVKDLKKAAEVKYLSFQLGEVDSKTL